MKFYKIDIIKTEKETDSFSPYYREVETEGVEPEEYNINNLEYETYRIEKVYTPMDKESYKYYAVKQDDNKLFSELISVSNTILENRMKEVEYHTK